MQSASVRQEVAPYSIEEGYVQKLITDLTSYGLTANQAKLYLYLLGNNPAQAKDISRALNVHRVDIYRRLHELEDFGIIEVYLDSPKKFAALDPNTTMTSLIRKAQSRVSILEHSRVELQRKLEMFAKSSRIQRSDPNQMPYSDSYYKFVKGTQQYFTEIAKLIQNAKQEILKISSANGLRRAMIMGLHKHYMRARERGVKIRLISEIKPDNIRYAKKFATLVELRHVNDVHFRFTIADRSVVLLSAKYDDRVISPVSGPDSYFLFNDPAFASASCFLFEHLWEGADTFEEKLEKLSLLNKNERIRNKTKPN